MANAHDTFIRDLFSRPEVAVDQFWPLMQPAWFEALAWPTLRDENGPVPHADLDLRA